MDASDFLRQMNRLSELESRVALVESHLRDRQHRDMLARVERLEKLERDRGRGATY